MGNFGPPPSRARQEGPEPTAGKGASPGVADFRAPLLDDAPRPLPLLALPLLEPELAFFPSKGRCSTSLSLVVVVALLARALHAPWVRTPGSEGDRLRLACGSGISGHTNSVLRA